MLWTARLNRALDYIEKHLDDEVSVPEAAGKAGCSSFHFQRMFFSIIGLTPSDYIRRRRMTLAATDLAAGNAKVIEIALKYGYDSPNAFTRAFRKMHGINPSDVRKAGVKLSAFQRVSFQEEITGGKNMDYRIIKKPAFQLIGKSKQFTNESFFKKAPAYWKEYVKTDDYQSLWDLTHGKWGRVSEAPLMSVYLPDENGSRDTFTDILGLEISSGIKHGIFEAFNIPAATYAEFNCTYQTAVRMNKYIYGEWFPSTGYERDEKKPDIAAYFPVVFKPLTRMGVRWWIPVIKRS